MESFHSNRNQIKTMDILTGVTYLKKTNSLSSTSHQWSIITQLGWDFIISTSSMLTEACSCTSLVCVVTKQIP